MSSDRVASDWSAQGGLTQSTLRSFVKLLDPAHNPETAKELASIELALSEYGRWSIEEEWRISTWIIASIASEPGPDGKTWFRVTVECDGQTLACRCPTPNRAFLYYRLYAHLIVYQFYGIGPPWAG